MHQCCSRRADVTPTNYFLRPETRHDPHQSSQCDAFLSQARDQCFTHLAKMRQNMITYWKTADFHETCSFIRLNDVFRKTLLQAAKVKSRKLTDHAGKTTSTARADFKCIDSVFSGTERIMGIDR